MVLSSVEAEGAEWFECLQLINARQGEVDMVTVTSNVVRCWRLDTVEAAITGAGAQAISCYIRVTTSLVTAPHRPP